MKSWIVYQTPEDKIEAVEDSHHDMGHELRAEQNVVLAFVSFKHKADAIDYVKQVIL